MTLGELTYYWNELSAISLYDYFVMRTTRSPSRLVYNRRNFMAHMARQTGISQQAADEITEKMTMNRHCTSTPDPVAVHNPQLAPLVRVEGGLFLAFTLIVLSMAHLRTTKLLQVAYSGNPTGRLRQQLGDEGEKRVCDLLKEKLRSDVLIANKVLVHKGNTRPSHLQPLGHSLRQQLGDEGEKRVCDLLKEKLRSDVLIANKVLVHKGNTRAITVTDLDVVVYVPGELLVVIQVKWHIMVNSQYEALYQQNRARKGRRDLETLREQMDAGDVQVQWPPEWGDVDADRCKRRWFVLTHDTMPVHNLGASDIKMRSLVLIQQLLPRSDHSVQDLVEVLDCPPTPIVGESVWETIRYGDWTFRVEHSTFHPNQPAPFTDIPAIIRKRNTGRSPPAPPS